MMWAGEYIGGVGFWTLYSTWSVARLAYSCGFSLCLEKVCRNSSTLVLENFLRCCPEENVDMTECNV